MQGFYCISSHHVLWGWSMHHFVFSACFYFYCILFIFYFLLAQISVILFLFLFFFILFLHVACYIFIYSNDRSFIFKINGMLHTSRFIAEIFIQRCEPISCSFYFSKYMIIPHLLMMQDRLDLFHLFVYTSQFGINYHCRWVP